MKPEQRILYLSHNQQIADYERERNRKAFVYSLLATAGLFAIAVGLSYIDHKPVNPNGHYNDYTNRLERITK